MSEANGHIELGVTINVDTNQIDIADDKVSTFVSNTKQRFADMGEAIDSSVYTGYPELQSAIGEGLDAAKSALASLPSFMATLAGDMRKSITPLIDELTSSMKSLGEVGSRVSGIDQYNKIVSMSMQVLDRATRLNNIMTTRSSLPQFAADSNATSVRNLVSSTADIIAREKRTTFTPKVLAEQLSQHPLFRQGISKMSGVEEAALDRKQLENIASYYLNLNGPRSYVVGPSRGRSEVFMKQAPQYAAIEDVAEPFREIFKSRGVGSNVARSSKTFDHGILKDLVSLVYGGNNEALQLAQRVGLARMNGGEVEWRRKATTDQINSLTGWWARRLSDAKAGSPLYESDPYSSWRLNNQVAELLEVQDVLSKYADKITPGIIEAQDRQAQERRWSARKNSYIAGGPLRKPKGAVSFVIPQTEFDAHGNLVYRDPQTANKNGVLETRDTDPFITFNESQLSRLLGFDPFTSADTFGYGRADNSKSIYGAPKVIKISSKNAFNYDSEGLLKQGAEARSSRAKYFEDLISGKTVEYGEEGNKRSYSMAYITNDGVYVIDTAIKKDIEDRAKQRGLQHIFEGFNVNGFIVPGDEKATNKQLSNARKMATPSIQLRSLGYNKGKDPRLGVVDLQSLYDTWDIMFPDAAKNAGYANKIDGSMLMDPSQTPTSFQGRAAIDALKFMAQRYNWRAELQSFITDDMIDGANQLITRTKNGFSLWLPSMTMPSEFSGLRDTSGKILGSNGKLSKSEVLRYMIGGQLSEKDARQIRNEYMTDVMNSRYGGIVFDSSIKNIDKFREMSVEDYIAMFRDKANQAKIDQAQKTGQLVKLNREEAERYLSEAIDFTGGIGMVKANDEFETQKNIMSRSQAQALNLPPSVYRKQAQVFERRLRRLNDIEYVRQHGLPGNAYFNRRMQEDPNWVYGNQARAIIQSEIKGLHTAKDRGAVFLERDSYSQLAQPLAGSTFAVLQELFGKTRPNDIQGSSLFDWRRYLQNEQQKLVDAGAKIMYAPDYKPDASGRVIGGRTPASPGTYKEFVNLAYRKNDEGKYVLNKELVNAMNQLGYDRHVVALNPEDIQDMNTGDFDGDTIWLYAGLGDEAYKRLSETNQHMMNARRQLANAETVKIGGKVNIYDPKERRPDDLGQAGVENMYHRIRSQIAMGRGAGGIRNVMANMSDDDPNKWLAIAELNDYYDLATSEVLNEGLGIDFGEFAKKSAASVGRSWDRFTKIVGDERVRGKDQEPYTGNIFKHYFANLHQPNDLGQILLNQTSKKNGLGDGGFRQHLSNWINEVYGSEGATADAARWFGEILSGQYFLDHLISQEDFRLQANEHIANMQAELNSFTKATPGQKVTRVKEQIDALRRMTDEMSKDNGSNFLFSDSLEALANGNAGGSAYQAGRIELAKALFANYTAEKQDEDLLGQYMQYQEGLNAQNQHIRELQEKIAKENEDMSIHDVVNQKIQNTADLDNFKTSFSFTQVEAWMRHNKRNRSLFSMPVTRKDLYTGTTERGYAAHAFGGDEAIASQEALELLNKDLNTPDTVLGTLMHQAYEQTIRKMVNAGLVEQEKVNMSFQPVSFSDAEEGSSKKKGKHKKPQMEQDTSNMTVDQFTGHQYLNGLFDETLLEILPQFRDAFKEVGINIDDITKGLSGEQPFGESITDITRIKGRDTFEQKLRALFRVNRDSSAPNSLLNELFGVGTYGRKIVQTEDTLYMPSTDKDGKVTYKELKLNNDNMDAFILPNVAGFKRDIKTHAKPDLVYEDEKGVFHMVDYKSSEGWKSGYGSTSGGSEQSLYQQMVYVKMLNSLAEEAYTTTDEERKKILSPYQRYGYMDKNGQFHSRFENGTVTGWSLDKNGIITVGLNERDANTGKLYMDMAEEEFYEAVKAKQIDLQNGYILGKIQLAADGKLSKEEREQVEKTQKAARERRTRIDGITDEKDRELLTKETKYLIDKYTEDEKRLDDIGGQIGKEARSYRQIGRNPYNRFASVQNDLDDVMNQEVLEAMYAEYLPRSDTDQASAVAIKGIEDSQVKRERYRSMLRETIHAAAGTDLERGKTILNSIRGGYERSDIESEIGKINSIVNSNLGSREALKTDKENGKALWDETTAIMDKAIWLSKHSREQVIDEWNNDPNNSNKTLTEEMIQELMRPSAETVASWGWVTRSDIERRVRDEWEQRPENKGKTLSDEELQTLMQNVDVTDIEAAAAQNKKRYMETAQSAEELKRLRETAISNVYTQHAADAQESLSKLIPKDDISVEEAIQQKYQNKFASIRSIILKYQDELMQLKDKFTATDEKTGAFVVQGSEREALESAISTYENALAPFIDENGQLKTGLLDKMQKHDTQVAKLDQRIQRRKDLALAENRGLQAEERAYIDVANERKQLEDLIFANTNNDGTTKNGRENIVDAARKRIDELNKGDREAELTTMYKEIDELTKQSMLQTANDIERKITGAQMSRGEFVKRAVYNFKTQVKNERSKAEKSFGKQSDEYKRFDRMLNNTELISGVAAQAQAQYEADQITQQQRDIQMLNKIGGTSSGFDATYAAQKQLDYKDFKKRRQIAQQKADENKRLQQQERELLQVENYEQWSSMYDEQNLGMMGLQRRDTVAETARRTWKKRQSEINRLKKAYSGEELQKHLQAYAPFMVQQQDYIDAELAKYDTTQGITTSSAARGLLASQLTPAQIPMLNKVFGMTGLGRAVMAREQRTSQFLGQYNTAALRVEQLQQQYDEAVRSGDQDKINQVGMQLAQARGNRQAVRMSGGLLMGNMNAWASDRVSSLSKQYSELQTQRTREAKRLQSLEKRNASQDKITEQRNKVNNIDQQMKSTQRGIAGAQAAATSFNAVGNALGGTIDGIVNSISRLASQFGRRLFMNAIREATQFVKQYDTSMRQIQAITLKTDSEMNQIRTDTINQAINLRTQTGNVAQVKSELYRQGLSDSEVDNRAESILKFATVTGMKVKAATKIITTALQNDLVNSAQEAMDVLTALGDSAATTAEEIGKGMQKSAAAAKVAGVSYEELASMLTIITSKTQLGGNQAGTALSAVFNRMHRVTSANLSAIDEEGNATSVNDVDKALKSAGVDLRDSQGQYRETTEVLRDLASVWQELNDLQKNAIMYAMAGGRQSNMFAALMEGFSEDGGEELDRLLGLAEGSEGSTETKYEIAVRGVQGAMEEMKQTFDGIVSDLTSGGQIEGVLSSVTGILNAIRGIVQSGQLIPAIIQTIVTVVGALIAKESILVMLKAKEFALQSGIAAAHSAASGDGYTAAARVIATTAAITAAVGAIQAIVGGVVLNGTLSSGQQYMENQQQESAYDRQTRIYNADVVNRTNVAKRVQPYIESAENIIAQAEAEGRSTLTEDEVRQLEHIQNRWNSMIDGIDMTQIQIENNTDSLESWKRAIDSASNSLDEYELITLKREARVRARNAQSKYEEMQEHLNLSNPLSAYITPGTVQQYALLDPKTFAALAFLQQTNDQASYPFEGKRITNFMHDDNNNGGVRNTAPRVAEVISDMMAHPANYGLTIRDGIITDSTGRQINPGDYFQNFGSNAVAYKTNLSDNDIKDLLSYITVLSMRPVMGVGTSESDIHQNWTYTQSLQQIFQSLHLRSFSEHGVDSDHQELNYGGGETGQFVATGTNRVGYRDLFNEVVQPLIAAWWADPEHAEYMVNLGFGSIDELNEAIRNAAKGQDYNQLTAPYGNGLSILNRNGNEGIKNALAYLYGNNGVFSRTSLADIAIEARTRDEENRTNSANIKRDYILSILEDEFGDVIEAMFPDSSEQIIEVAVAEFINRHPELSLSDLRPENLYDFFLGDNGILTGNTDQIRQARYSGNRTALSFRYRYEDGNGHSVGFDSTDFVQMYRDIDDAKAALYNEHQDIINAQGEYIGEGDPDEVAQNIIDQYQFLMETQEEIHEAINDVEKQKEILTNRIRNNKTGAHAEMNIDELFEQLGGNITAKDRNYIDQWRLLYTYMRQQQNADQLDNLVQGTAQFPNLEPFLKSDSTLLEMWNSVRENDGHYTWDALVNYVYEKLYGSSSSAQQIGLNQQRTQLASLGYLNEVLSNESAPLTWSQAQQISQITGQYASDLMTDPNARAAARRIISASYGEQRTTYDQTLRNYATNLFNGNLQLANANGANVKQFIEDQNREREITDENGFILEDLRNNERYAVGNEITAQNGMRYRVTDDHRLAPVAVENIDDLIGRLTRMSEKGNAEAESTLSRIRELQDMGAIVSISDDGRLVVSGGEVSAEDAARLALYDFSPVYTNRQMRDFGQTLLADNRSWNEINGDNRYQPDDLAAIKQYNPDLYRYLTMSETQRESDEGRRLRRNIEIGFKVSDLADLEQAGELLQGTADLVERLNRNGIIKIKAEIEVVQTAQSFIDNVGAYLNGTPAEQRRALMSMVGVDDENFYLDNITSFGSEEEIVQAYIAQEVASLNEELAAMDPVRRMARIQELRRQGWNIGYEQVQESDEPVSVMGNGSSQPVVTGLDMNRIRETTKRPYLSIERRITSQDIADAFADYNPRTGFSDTVKEDEELMQAILQNGELATIAEVERRRGEIESLRTRIQNAERAGDTKTAAKLKAALDELQESLDEYIGENAAQIAHEKNKTILKALSDALSERVNRGELSEQALSLLEGVTNGTQTSRLQNAVSSANTISQDRRLQQMLNSESQQDVDSATMEILGLSSLSELYSGQEADYVARRRLAEQIINGRISDAQDAAQAVLNGQFTESGQPIDNIRIGGIHNPQDNTLIRRGNNYYRYRDGSWYRVTSDLLDEYEAAGYLQEDSRGVVTVTGPNAEYNPVDDYIDHQTVATNAQIANAQRAAIDNNLRTWDAVIHMDGVTPELAAALAGDEDFKRLIKLRELEDKLRANGDVLSAEEQQELQALEMRMNIKVQTSGLQSVEEMGEALEGTVDLITRLNRNGLIRIRAEYSAIGNASDMANLIALSNSSDAHEREQALAQLAGVSWETYDANRELFNLLNPGLTRTAGEQQAKQVEDAINIMIGKGDLNPATTESVLREMGYDVEMENGKIKINQLPAERRNTNPFLQVQRNVTAQEIAGAINENGFVRADASQEVREAIASNTQYEHIAYRQRLRDDYINARQDYASARRHGTDEDIAKARERWIAAADAYGTYSNQYKYEIESEQRAAQFAAMEAENQIRSGTAQMFTDFGSRDLQTRNAAISSASSLLGQSATAMQYSAMLSQNADNTNWWNSRGVAMVQELGQMFNWSDELVRSFQDPQNKDRLQQAIDESVQDINNTFAQSISKYLGVQNLEGFKNLEAVINALTETGDDAARAMADFLRQMSGVIELSNGQLTAKSGTPSYASFSQQASIQSGYGAQQQNLQILQTAYNAITQGNVTNTEGLYKTLTGAGYFDSPQDAEEFFKNNPQLAEEFARAVDNGGTITRPFIQALEDAMNIGGLHVNTNELDYYNRLMGVHSNDEMRAQMTGDAEFEQYVSGLEGFDEYQAAVTALDLKAQPENIERYNEALRNLQLSARLAVDKGLRPFGDETEEVNDVARQMAGGIRSQTSALRSYTQTLQTVSNNQFYRTQWRSGDRSQRTVEAIAEQTGFSKEDIRSGLFDDVINSRLDMSERADASSIETIAEGMFTDIQARVGEAFSGKTITIDGAEVEITSPQLQSMGMDELKEKFGDYLSDEQLNFIAMLEAAGLQAHANVIEDGKGGFKLDFTIDSLGKGRKNGSGGGGGGKSDAQKLIEKLERQKKMFDHRLKMLQYTESFYEDRGEYTNVNQLLQHEEVDLRTELIDQYNDSIQELLGQMAKTEKGSDDWYTLRDAVLTYEEAIEECKNAIDAINRKLIENQQAARKTRIELEDTVDQEIRARIQRERDMLDGTVQMQEQILDAIRARYQEEWNLMTRDMDKKRQALEEEKNLIAERLDERKEAEDEAAKYEELAELRRQYAMISMDSTRTKDAAELRDKIAELEKELAYNLAEDEATAQQETLQDQIDAYDQFQQNGEEDLQYYLDDAHNFAIEVNELIAGEQSDLFDWLMENVKQYTKSLEEAQKQMVNSWTDTFKQMRGIYDTFWPEIDEILMSEDDFVAYMKESQDYINASDMDKAYMEQEWRTAYQDYVSAFLTGADWEHWDDFDQYGTDKPKTNGSGGNGDDDTDKDVVHGYAAKFNGKERQFITREAAETWLETMKTAWILNRKNTDLPDYGIHQFASGGLVDFTGPAWVDGTSMRPEAFLSPEDTALMRSFLDAAKYVRIKPFMSNIDGASFNNNGVSIGDVNINITEASFESDADIEEVAHRVGDVFVRELTKSGFNTANYSF